MTTPLKAWNVYTLMEIHYRTGELQCDHAVEGVECALINIETASGCF